MKTRHMSTGALLGAFAAALVPAAGQHPQTFSLVPYGGNVVRGGDLVTVEMFFANVGTIPRQYVGWQVTATCSAVGRPGSTGTITEVGITTDPDGDGSRGPSAGGFPSSSVPTVWGR